MYQNLHTTKAMNKPNFNMVDYKLVKLRRRSQRKSNFSHKEMDILVREFMKYRQILLTRINSDRVRQAKADRWHRIAICVNGVSNTERSEYELKKKWNNLFTEARARATKIRKAKEDGLDVTEDGDIKVLTELDKMVLDANDRKDLGDIDHDETLLGLEESEMDISQCDPDPFVGLYSIAPEEEEDIIPPEKIKVEEEESVPVPVKVTPAQPTVTRKTTNLIKIAPKTSQMTSTITTPSTANPIAPFGPVPVMLSHATQQREPQIPRIASVASLAQPFNNHLNSTVSSNSINDLREDVRALVEVERERLAVERERLQVEKSRLELQEELLKLKWEKYSAMRKQNHKD